MAPPNASKPATAQTVDGPREVHAVQADKHLDTGIRPASQGTPALFCAAIQKSSAVQVRVVINAWRGHFKLHIREHTDGAIQGEWWPTAKGATLDLERLPELL